MSHTPFTKIHCQCDALLPDRKEEGNLDPANPQQPSKDITSSRTTNACSHVQNSKKKEQEAAQAVTFQALQTLFLDGEYTRCFSTCLSEYVRSPDLSIDAKHMILLDFMMASAKNFDLVLDDVADDLETLQENAETEHPYIAALIYLVLFELSSEPEHLALAKTALESMTPHDVLPLNDLIQDRIIQLKDDVAVAESLIPVETALNFKDQGNIRALRDYLMSQLDKLPPGLSYARDACLQLFWESFLMCDTLDQKETVITSDDAACAKHLASLEQAHPYHRAISMFTAYIVSCNLKNPKPNRLYSALALFQSLKGCDNHQYVWCSNEVIPLGQAVFAEDDGWLSLVQSQIPTPSSILSPRSDVDFFVESKNNKGHWCDVCLKPRQSDALSMDARVLRKCERCESEFYCSRYCQKRGWEAGHKSNCRALGEFEVGDLVMHHSLFGNAAPMNGVLMELVQRDGGICSGTTLDRNLKKRTVGEVNIRLILTREEYRWFRDEKCFEKGV
ncbi:hypothetical protein HDU98_009809 [Podochytrium sp. JEL0797]|nr:hypothetical protein HDU98_009809 [Podochytrium sp. JEL0797]